MRLLAILAIDPGPHVSAWCFVRDAVPICSDKVENDLLLRWLREKRWDEDTYLCIEMIESYGMAVGREVFDTCVWIGRFIESWDAHHGFWQRVSRREVKLHMCSSMRANDANIRAALIDHFGPGHYLAVGTKKQPGPLYGFKADEWAALAVALTVDAQLRRAPAKHTERAL